MTNASSSVKTADIARRIRAALKSEQLSGSLAPHLRFTVRSHVSRTSDSITVTVEGFGPTHAIQEEPNGWPVLISAPAARTLSRQVEALMNADRDQRGPRLFLFANVAMDQVSYAQVEAELLERQGRWTRQQHTPTAPAPAAVAEPPARALHIVRPVIG